MCKESCHQPWQEPVPGSEWQWLAPLHQPLHQPGLGLRALQPRHLAAEETVSAGLEAVPWDGVSKAGHSSDQLWGQAQGAWGASDLSAANREGLDSCALPRGTTGCLPVGRLPKVTCLEEAAGFWLPPLHPCRAFQLPPFLLRAP